MKMSCSCGAGCIVCMIVMAGFCLLVSLLMK